MKLVLIGLVALLLLGGGGAGAYFYFMKPAEAAGGEMAEHEKAQAEAHAKAEDEHGEAPGVNFVELAPLILPIIDDNGVSQVVSIVIAIEVPATIETSQIKKMTPRLNDAYIQDMYGVLNRKAVMNGGVIEVGKLKARLTKITKQILGEEQVNDVLLQVVQQRPI